MEEISGIISVAYKRVTAAVVTAGDLHGAVILELIVNQIVPVAERVIAAGEHACALVEPEVVDKRADHIRRSGGARAGSVGHIDTHATCIHQFGHGIGLLGGIGSVIAVEHIIPVEALVGVIKRIRSAVIRNAGTACTIACRQFVIVDNLSHGRSHAACHATAISVGRTHIIERFALIPDSLDHRSDGLPGRGRSRQIAVGRGIFAQPFDLGRILVEPPLHRRIDRSRVKLAAVAIAQHRCGFVISRQHNIALAAVETKDINRRLIVDRTGSHKLRTRLLHTRRHWTGIAHDTVKSLIRCHNIRPATKGHCGENTRK